jgi:hypothetical protein
MWLYVNSFRLCVCVCVCVCVWGGGTYLVETGSRTDSYIQPHTDTLYNKCKSTFQFSNLAKYGHGPLEDGFKGEQNM